MTVRTAIPGIYINRTRRVKNSQAGSTLVQDYGTNYAWLNFSPVRSPMDYGHSPGPVQELVNKGFKYIRVPFNWEHVQPTLFGSLNMSMVTPLKTICNEVNAVGGKVIIDMHNFGDYTDASNTVHRIGSSGTLTPAAFADVWSKLATELVGQAGLFGYDLMNEPHDLVNNTVWVSYAQAAINSIRAVDTTRPIFIEGNHWSAAWAWQTVNPTLHTLTDPSNNLIFSAHTYLDRDSSGQHYDWAVEVANGSYTEIGRDRIAVFVSWLQQYGFRGHIGEIGAGQDSGWMAALESALQYCKDNNVIVTGWSAGNMWGTYPYSMEPEWYQGRYKSPTVNSVYYKVWNKPQMDIFDSGSQVGTAGSPTTITVYGRGYSASAITINLSVSGGGTLNTTSIVLPAGYNPSATYTITAGNNTTSQVTYSRAGGAQVPPVRGYIVGQSLLELSGVQNAVGLYRIIATWAGNCIRLMRVSDSAQADFGFVALGRYQWVDNAAITTWANGSALKVIKVYDQSGNNYDAVPVFSDGSGWPSMASVPTDYPDYIINAGNGFPAIRCVGGTTRMDMTSPIEGRTQLSTIAAVKPANDQWLMWWEMMQGYKCAGSSFDVGPESPVSVTMNQTLNAWQIAATTHTCGTNSSTYRRTWKNGASVASAACTLGSIVFNYRNNLNVGWFRYWQVGWSGDWTSMVVLTTDVTNNIATICSDFKTLHGIA